MILALEEWASGQFSPFPDWLEITLLMNVRIMEAIQLIDEFKEADSRGWHSFCARVHAHGSRPNNSLALPRVFSCLSQSLLAAGSEEPENSGDEIVQ